MTEIKDITKSTPYEMLDMLDSHYGLGLHLKESINVYDRLDVMWAFRELVIRLRPIVELYDEFERRLNLNFDNLESIQTHDGIDYTAYRRMREYRVVDVPKLLVEQPQLYEELSYVDAVTFKKYFGESRMRGMLREFMNEEGEESQPLPFEKIRLDDLVKELGEAGAVPYLTSKQQFGYIFIKRKDSSENESGYPDKYWNPGVIHGV